MEKVTSLSATFPHGHPTIYFGYWEKYLIIEAALLVCDYVKTGAVLLSAFRQSYWLHAIVRTSAWRLLCKTEAFGVCKNTKIHFQQLLLLRIEPKHHPPDNNKNTHLSQESIPRKPKWSESFDCFLLQFLASTR